jgi:putative sigma-54 modulation protein
MYAAIDGLVDKLDRTILKHKEKHLAQRHDGAAIKHQEAE